MYVKGLARLAANAYLSCMPTEKTLTVRIQLLLTPEDAEAIDDWGFANRIRTRSEAIRRLCSMALDAERKKA